MCYRPLHLANPKLQFNPQVDKPYIEVPCGKCAQCKNRKVTDLQVRSSAELDYCLSKGGNMAFVTLTYDNVHIPQVNNVYGFSIKDIQNFKKRLNITLSRRFNLRFDKETYVKYFFVCEYGGITKRPHYHALLWWSFPCSRGQMYYLVKKEWQNGFISFGSAHKKHLNPSASIKYVCKYICKDQKSQEDEKNIPDSIKPFKPLFSKYIGISRIKDMSEQDILSLFHTGSMLLQKADGKQIPVPIPNYYRRKLLYDVVNYCSIEKNPLFSEEKLDGIYKYFYDVKSLKLQEYGKDFEEVLEGSKLYDEKTHTLLIPKIIYWDVRYEEYIKSIKLWQDNLSTILQNSKFFTDENITKVSSTLGRTYPSVNSILEGLRAQRDKDNFKSAAEYCAFFRNRYIVNGHDKPINVACNRCNVHPSELTFFGVDYDMEFCYIAVNLLNAIIGFKLEEDYKSYKNLVYNLKFYSNDYTF